MDPIDTAELAIFERTGDPDLAAGAGEFLRHQQRLGAITAAELLGLRIEIRKTD